jgi:hypothetical protein
MICLNKWRRKMPAKRFKQFDLETDEFKKMWLKADRDGIKVKLS